MFTVIVTIQVVPECVQDFISITRYNASNSRLEAGVVRFDFFQELDRPESFRLVEIYREQADQAAHQQTEHYIKWREAAAPMMAAERTRVFLRNLDPTDAEWL
ncbi:MAG TPA: putative quinol monooxygenase [Anaerolineaceae bacterium]|jgi:autoinducer 2-degrading protein|nr:putative quinol monooxygenase [Anaerolineaceae bacterium]